MIDVYMWSSLHKCSQPTRPQLKITRLTSRGVNCLTKYRKVPTFNSGSESRNTYLLVLYVAVAIIFFYIVSLNQRNYQDVWILDGIVVPTVVFVSFSLVVETLVQENRKAVIFAAFFLFAMNLIPGIKYQSFYGVFDTPGHFKFTNAIVSSGRIPETEFYSKSYKGNPGMHILMSCVSIVSGIPVNDIFKFVIPALLSISPLIIYFVTKGLLSDITQRYVIIFSSFPILAGYLVWGTSLAMILYLLLIAMFLKGIFAKRCQREFWLLFAILGFGLIVSHSVTSLFAAFLLMGTPLILKSLKMTRTKISMSLDRFLAFTSVAPSLLYVVLLISWWAVESPFNLETLAGFVRALFIGGDVAAPIPKRFHQLPLLAQMQVLTVFYSGYFVIGVLSLFGLFIFLRKSRRKEFSNKTRAFYLHLMILLSIIVLFLSFQFAFGFGSIQYVRFMINAIPLCIPLAGLTLGQLYGFFENIFSKIVRNITFALVLVVLVLACLIQFFPYQPLIPKADVLSNNLPNNEFIDYVGMVNTPYQKEMISFAERYTSDAWIASDAVTRYQIYGFSNYSFFSRHIWHSPLSTDKDLQWDLFLLHTKKAGPFQEQVEYRTEERIESLRLNAGNIVYDNGESFIISR
jgi:uncharacterized membrane protein